jgi:hypothetical protein
LRETTKTALHRASEKTGETVRNINQNLHEFEAAGKKLKRFVGTKADAEEHGLEIDNEYIVNGYRVHHGTYCRAFKSICSCHNETTNVWSHLGGAVFFLIMLCGLMIWVVPGQFSYNKVLV